MGFTPAFGKPLPVLREETVDSIRFQFFETKTNPRAPVLIAKMVKAFKPLLSNFSIPPRIVVRLRSDEEEGADSTGYITYDTKWLLLDPALEPVFMHEYAHVVFSHIQNLARVLPKGSDYLAFIEEKNQLRMQMERLRPNQVEEKAQLYREAKYLDYSYEDHPIQRVVKSYNEFFADLFAVLALNDAKGMAHVEKDIVRSFDPAAIAPSDYLDQIDPHQYFFSSRKYIWRVFQNLRSSPEATRVIMSNVYQIIWAEILTRSKSENLILLSKAEIDERFLQALKSHPW